MSKTPDIRVRASEEEKSTLKTGARLAGRLPISTWLRLLGLSEAKRLMRKAQEAPEREVK